MQLALERYASGELLLARVEGSAHAEAIKSKISELAETPEFSEATKTLVDLRNAECRLTGADVYDICRILAYPEPAIPSTLRLAVVVPSGPRFDLAAFFETCARNRNLTTRAFRDPESAVDWLTIS